MRPRATSRTALLLSLGLLAGCAGTPTATAPATPGATPATDAPPATGAASPAPSATTSATHPLFGEPPPVDPCSLVQESEAATVLEQPIEGTTTEESSGGASTSCVFETGDPLTRVAITVVKEPQTAQQFLIRREAFGDAAQPVDDLGTGAFTVAFSQVVTAYVLKGTLQFYIDVSRADRMGRDIRERALALAERALDRLPSD